MKKLITIVGFFLFSNHSYAFFCPEGICPPSDFFEISAHTATPTLLPDPTYEAIFKSVNQSTLIQLLKNTAGVEPVQVGGETYSISNRYTPQDKKNFRKFWIQYFNSLKIPVSEMAFPTQHNNGENEGHNIEAVLPGKSADSVVIIVHYDSMGMFGQETSNPGVDDDMTGMSMLMETARIFSQHGAELEHTVRFVAADYEEWGDPGLQGARVYAKYIQAKAQRENFKIIAAIDDEQTGWNCANEGGCASHGDIMSVFSCGDTYNFQEIGDHFEQTVQQYSQFKVQRGCIGQNSDHYAMWEIGVPAVVFSEYDPFSNPHFDQNGGDTFDKIDQNYFYHIAQVGITFAAEMVKLKH